MARYRSFRDLDWPLLAITLIICALGVLQIYSATHDTQWQDAWWKQIIWIAVALGMMWVVTSIDYHTLLAQVPILYGLSIAALLAIAFGKLVFGSRRWIRILGFNFQISEFVKLVIILVVARYLSELKRDEVSLRDLLKLGGLVGIPAALGDVPAGSRHRFDLPADSGGRDSDGGDSMALSGGDRAGGRTGIARRLVFPEGLSEGASGDVYRSVARSAGLRISGNSVEDRRGRRRHVGTRRYARHADAVAVFAGAAHRFHLFGLRRGAWICRGVVVLGLYFLLLMQIVQNAQRAPDRAGMYICMGVATLLLFHVLVNVGMVVGNMPVTGIPLPLMSSGGSNMFSVFMMLGLVNNVRLRRFAS